MENSMPYAVLNICIDDIKCEYLKEYINNRQKNTNKVQ